MIAYRYDNNGLYIGEVTCQLDPRETQKAGHDVYLLPAMATYTEPLEAKEGFNVVWNGSKWEYVEIPVPPTPEPHIPTTEEKLAELDARYNADKSELMTAYLNALVYGNTDLAEEIKSEIEALDEQYDNDYEVIIGGDV